MCFRKKKGCLNAFQAVLCHLDHVRRGVNKRVEISTLLFIFEPFPKKVWISKFAVQNKNKEKLRLQRTFRQVTSRQSLTHVHKFFKGYNAVLTQTGHQC